jgi:hypothetical protein
MVSRFLYTFTDIAPAGCPHFMSFMRFMVKLLTDNACTETQARLDSGPEP